jgi:hypothetical protein
MATNKDLVEASAFERRRLVNAFLSGARRSPEPERAAVGRMIFGSVVLALLLLAGTAVTRYVAPVDTGVLPSAHWAGKLAWTGGRRHVVPEAAHRDAQAHPQHDQARGRERGGEGARLERGAAGVRLHPRGPDEEPVVHTGEGDDLQPLGRAGTCLRGCQRPGSVVRTDGVTSRGPVQLGAGIEGATR